MLHHEDVLQEGGSSSSSQEVGQWLAMAVLLFMLSWRCCWM
jgi:hypothetical protein